MKIQSKLKTVKTFLFAVFIFTLPIYGTISFCELSFNPLTWVKTARVIFTSLWAIISIACIYTILLDRNFKIKEDA